MRWKRYNIKSKDGLSRVLRKESISWTWNRDKERIVIYCWNLIEETGLWHISIYKKDTHLFYECIPDCSQEQAEDRAITLIDGYISTINQP